MRHAHLLRVRHAHMLHMRHAHLSRVRRAHMSRMRHAHLLCVRRLPCHPRAQVNKDDLMNMVRYGAEMVFSSEPTNLTEAGARARKSPCSALLCSAALSLPCSAVLSLPCSAFQ